MVIGDDDVVAKNDNAEPLEHPSKRRAQGLSQEHNRALLSQIIKDDTDLSNTASLLANNTYRATETTVVLSSSKEIPRES